MRIQKRVYDIVDYGAMLTFVVALVSYVISIDIDVYTYWNADSVTSNLMAVMFYFNKAYIATSILCFVFLSVVYFDELGFRAYLLNSACLMLVIMAFWFLHMYCITYLLYGIHPEVYAQSSLLFAGSVLFIFFSVAILFKVLVEVINIFKNT